MSGVDSVLLAVYGLSRAAQLFPDENGLGFHLASQLDHLGGRFPLRFQVAQKVIHADREKRRSFGLFRHTAMMPQPAVR